LRQARAVDTQRMPTLPDDFLAFRDAVLVEGRAIEGGLTDAEMRFLVALGACRTAEGDVLEIGSYLGRSTVVLAKCIRRFGGGSIIAIDPLTSPSITDPDLKGRASCAEQFQANIAKHGVAGSIEFHQAFSHDVAPGWKRPLRLLWHDGDHTYRGAKRDFLDFEPHLVDRGLFAMHDVLHKYQGPLRVFMEDVLLSDRFGACGLCRSIGWGQKTSDPAVVARWKPFKVALYRKLSRLVPLVAFDQRPDRGLARKRWQWWRKFIDNREPAAEAFAAQLAG
jgi:hypothetical protein